MCIHDAPFPRPPSSPCIPSLCSLLKPFFWNFMRSCLYLQIYHGQHFDKGVVARVSCPKLGSFSLAPGTAPYRQESGCHRRQQPPGVVQRRPRFVETLRRSLGSAKGHPQVICAFTGRRMKTREKAPPLGFLFIPSPPSFSRGQRQL